MLERSFLKFIVQVLMAEFLAILTVLMCFRGDLSKELGPWLTTIVPVGYLTGMMAILGNFGRNVNRR